MGDLMNSAATQTLFVKLTSGEVRQYDNVSSYEVNLVYATDKSDSNFMMNIYADARQIDSISLREIDSAWMDNGL